MSDTDSDSDEISRIREQKLEALKRELSGEAEPEAESAVQAPDDPIYIDGPAHLDEVVNEYDVVLADFYADWCGPCKMIEPIVEEIAQESDAAVVKVDIDRNQRLAQQQGVQGVPTLFLYAGGSVAERMVGAQNKASLLSLIDRHSAA